MSDELLNAYELLENYSRALDEIYRLRTALAYEAQVTALHLRLVTFPKSRRTPAECQIRRMTHAAQGNSAEAYAPVHSWMLRQAREALGIEGLTRSQFEAEKPRPGQS